jgi:hypothetical protein
MALAVYVNDPITGLSDQIVNNTTMKVVAFHDTTDGSYRYQMLTVRNTVENLGYTNISVSIAINGVTNGPISNNGIIYQLIPMESATADIRDQNWENLPYNNTITLVDIEPGAIRNRYLMLKTFVPKGNGVNFFSEATIKINATETTLAG